MTLIFRLGNDITRATQYDKLPNLTGLLIGHKSLLKILPNILPKVNFGKDELRWKEGFIVLCGHAAMSLAGEIVGRYFRRFLPAAQPAAGLQAAFFLLLLLTQPSSKSAKNY